MHEVPLTGTFLVDGVPSELTVDQESISWRRTGKEGGRRLEFGQVIAVKPVTNLKRQAKAARVRAKAKTSPEGDASKSTADGCFLPEGRRGLQVREEGVGKLDGCNKLKVYYAKQRVSGLIKLKRLTICSKVGENAHDDVDDDDNNKRRHDDGFGSSGAVRRGLKMTPEPDKGHEVRRAGGRASCHESESSHLSSLSSASSSIGSASPVHDELTAAQCESRQAKDTKNESAERQPDGRAAIAKSLDEIAETIAHRFELRRDGRPERLLIFVNPFGGKGKALQVYKSQVRRLMDLAGVEAKLVVTKYANHARDTIEDPLFNVEHFDGVVCIGGDGMFSELMNGLLFRYNRERILKAELRSLNKSFGLGGWRSPTNCDNLTDDELEARHHHHLDRPISPCSSTSTHQSNDSSLSSDTRNQLDTGHNQQQSSDKTNGHHLSLDNLRTSLGGIGKQFRLPPVAVGVIGAGSTDANSFGLIGTNDVITATLNIILGKQIRIDVCSIHSYNEDRLLRFVSTFVAYGYFGDVVRESEKLRWLGPSRYDLTGVNTLIRNRAYKGLVRVLLSDRDGSPRDLNRCHQNCPLCRQDDAKTDSDHFDELDDKNLKIIEKQGSFIGVNAAVTACRCPKTKKGFSPSQHLSNGCADLILVRPCSRVQYVNYLLRTGWTKKSAFDLEYVDAYRCRQFEFVASNQELSASSGCSSSASSVDHYHSNSLDSKDSKDTNEQVHSAKGAFSSWNVDGEILNEQSIRVKVNKQLLRVFGTGEPQRY